MVVAKRARERESANWRFRTFLKCIDLESEELDASVYRHYEEVAGRIDCSACGNRCRVYAHRPDTCRSYPHLDKEGFVFHLAQTVSNCAVCPIVFNVMERLKAELGHGSVDRKQEAL